MTVKVTFVSRFHLEKTKGAVEFEHVILWVRLCVTAHGPANFMILPPREI